MEDFPQHLPHLTLPPHQETFSGQFGYPNLPLGVHPLLPYHDITHYVCDVENPYLIFRFFSEFHINPYRFLLWSQALDMELAHTNVFINLYILMFKLMLCDLVLHLYIAVFFWIGDMFLDR